MSHMTILTCARLSSSEVAGFCNSDGAAAFGCIEGLRQNGYSGEITMITTDFEYPYDRTKLYKSIRNLDYEKLYLRPKEWYDLFGVTILFGREVA